MVLGILVGGGWGRRIVLGMCVTVVDCGLGIGLGLGICKTSQVSGQQSRHHMYAIICKSRGRVLQEIDKSDGGRHSSCSKKPA